MNKLTKVIKKIYYLEKKIQGIEEISKVKMDSREIGEGDLFFAINNGKNYIEDALKKGVSLVISNDKNWGNNSKVLIVKDPIKSMQQIAKEYRKTLDTKIVGIVGSNGKTTTKDILYSIVSSKYNSKKTNGNYNNHIGLPFSILQLEEKDEFGILEMGMSNFGEIELLCQIASLNYAVITNIGESHLEFMLNKRNVFLEKSIVKNYVKDENLFFYGDDPYLKELKGGSIGFEKTNTHIISNYKLLEKGISFVLDEIKYEIKIYGEHNCIDASLAIEVAKKIGMKEKEIKEGLENINLTPMRFQKVIKNGVVFINDSYNSSPISVKFSIDTFFKLKSNKEKVVVLADMEELGEKEIEFHKEILKYTLEKNFFKIILYGEKMTKASEELRIQEKVLLYDSKHLIRKLIYKELNDKLILIKGSNSSRLWEILE